MFVLQYLIFLLSFFNAESRFDREIESKSNSGLKQEMNSTLNVRNWDWNPYPRTCYQCQTYREDFLCKNDTDSSSWGQFKCASLCIDKWWYINGTKHTKKYCDHFHTYPEERCVNFTENNVRILFMLE